MKNLKYYWVGLCSFAFIDTLGISQTGFTEIHEWFMLEPWEVGQLLGGN